MTYLNELYGDTSLTTLTDLYQLTMAQGYWDQGRTDTQASFYHFFREPPFGGGYAITAGMSPLAEFIESFQFTEDDLEYLGRMEGNNGNPLFQDEFLSYLHGMELDVDIDAVEEGTPVFPHEPILHVKGPLIQCQLLETAILNLVNFQTLIATKARRVTEAADDGVLEFGLRRAQGIDGGVSASRAAMIGGCAGTSNVLAGKLLDIPVKGTHAHSWVCSFDTEMEAFEAYAESLPNNCVFLVDTYDSIEGTKKAVEVGKKLRERGYDMVGIRLDSGDLTELSKKARKILDDNGFEDAAIVASDGLDEHKIKEMRSDGAQIALWGVGTNLATAKDQPALGGVYKLAAKKDADDYEWKPKMKISSPLKTSIPGPLGARRYYNEYGEPVADDIYNIKVNGVVIDDWYDPMTGEKIDVSNVTDSESLLKPFFEDGELQDGWHRPVEEIAEESKEKYDRLPEEAKKLTTDYDYPVGLTEKTHELREEIIEDHEE